MEDGTFCALLLASLSSLDRFSLSPLSRLFLFLRCATHARLEFFLAFWRQVLVTMAVISWVYRELFPLQECEGTHSVEKIGHLGHEEVLQTYALFINEIQKKDTEGSYLHKETIFIRTGLEIKLELIV